PPEVGFLCPGIGGRIIFPEGICIGAIIAGADIAFGADGKSCSCPTFYHPGFLYPGIGGGIKFPEIRVKEAATIGAGTDISFAADEKSYWIKSCRSSELSFLSPSVL